MLAAVRRRELDAILVWRLDRWGRSLADLVVTLKELAELSIGFVSLTEAFDMTTPSGSSRRPRDRLDSACLFPAPPGSQA